MVAQVTPPTRQQSQDSMAFILPSTVGATQSLDAGITSTRRERSPSLSPSPRHYAFTPQRVQTLPRAWERRPATPYVPRNETQKIWKRVPLGTVDLNNDGWGWRKGHPTADRRSVKRLRVGSDNGEEDKENENYVAVKWDDDGLVENSPKRKEVLGFDGSADLEIAADDHVVKSSKVEKHSDDELFTGLDKHGDNEPSTKVDKHGGDEASAGVDSHSHDDAQVTNKDGAQVQSPVKWAENASASEAVVSPTTSHNERCSLAGGSSLQRLPLSTESVDVAISNSCRLATAVPSQQDTLTPSPQLCSLEEGDEAYRPSDGPSSIPNSNEVINFPIDHDDFPVLQNFLSRSQAKRAAKEEIPQHAAQPSMSPLATTKQSSEKSASVQLDGGLEEMADEAVREAVHSPSGDVNESSTNATHSRGEDEILAPDQDVDANNSSPCRRSSRLNTKLSRPKKPAATLPSNISLKRLNGTEFVATQGEGQSLAITTRTNTRRNKGASVSVKVKLIQLRAEEKAREMNPTPPSDPISRKKQVPRKVKWEGVLARFEDGSVFEKAGDAESLDDETDEVEDSADKEAVEDKQEEPAKRADPPEAKEKPARKVRNLRKLNVGTVNGTPAPKRTTSIPVPVGAGPPETLMDAMKKRRASKASEDKVAGGQKRAQMRPKRRTGTST